MAVPSSWVVFLLAAAARAASASAAPSIETLDDGGMQLTVGEGASVCGRHGEGAPICLPDLDARTKKLEARIDDLAAAADGEGAAGLEEKITTLRDGSIYFKTPKNAQVCATPEGSDIICLDVLNTRTLETLQRLDALSKKDILTATNFADVVKADKSLAADIEKAVGVYRREDQLHWKADDEEGRVELWLGAMHTYDVLEVAFSLSGCAGYSQSFSAKLFHHAGTLTAYFTDAPDPDSDTPDLHSGTQIVWQTAPDTTAGGSVWPKVQVAIQVDVAALHKSCTQPGSSWSKYAHNWYATITSNTHTFEKMDQAPATTTGGFQTAVITELSAQAGAGPGALQYTVVDTAASASPPACTAATQGHVAVATRSTVAAEFTLQFCNGTRWLKLAMA